MQPGVEKFMQLTQTQSTHEDSSCNGPTGHNRCIPEQQETAARHIVPENRSNIPLQTAPAGQDHLPQSRIPSETPAKPDHGHIGVR